MNYTKMWTCDFNANFNIRAFEGERIFVDIFLYHRRFWCVFVSVGLGSLMVNTKLWRLDVAWRIMLEIPIGRVRATG